MLEAARCVSPFQANTAALSRATAAAAWSCTKYTPFTQGWKQ